VSVLSGTAIRQRLARQDEDRLVVSPLLAPDEQVRTDQASIDLRLGFTFALVTPSSHGAIDEFSEKTQEEVVDSIAALYNVQYVPFGGRLVIHPHQFILAASLEYIRLPRDITAQVLGRSTWGRLGLIVATAVAIQPYFSGTLTLELRNLGETPLVLYPGQCIAQLFFYSVEQPNTGEGGIGQYSGSIDLLPRNMSSALTHSMIENFLSKSKSGL
jgi:dCTP deaminase